MTTAVYLYRTDMGTSRALLLGCARDYAARCGIASPDLTVGKEIFGKPYFPNCPELHFSVSHSGAYWLCAFSLENVGADIQIMRPVNLLRIVRRLYSPEESAVVQRRGRTAFFELWSAKEAYLKYTGAGLGYLKNNVETAMGGDVARRIHGVPIRMLDLPVEDYVACIAGGTETIRLFDYRTK